MILGSNLIITRRWASSVVVVVKMVLVVAGKYEMQAGCEMQAAK